jgi:hypothetical protein
VRNGNWHILAAKPTEHFQLSNGHVFSVLTLKSERCRTEIVRWISEIIFLKANVPHSIYDKTGSIFTSGKRHKLDDHK